MRGALLLAVLAGSAPSRAEGGAPPIGRWTAADPAGDQRAVEAGIERVAQAFPSLARPIVRAYLGRVTRHCPAPGFAWDGPRLCFLCDGREVLGAVPDGHPFSWTTRNGEERYTVSLLLQPSGAVELGFSDPMGSRTETWTPRNDGTLGARFVYRSERLPVPLEYELGFSPAP